MSKIFRLHSSSSQNSWADDNLYETLSLSNNLSNNLELKENIENHEIIWRYMDLTKFLYILKEKKLYLTRTDKFEDKFESNYTKLDYEKNDNVLSLNKYPFNDRVKLINLLKKGSYYISCWHLNNYESFAMWNLYTDRKQGIAIKTNVGKLKKCICEACSLISGKVTYLDFEKDSIINYWQEQNKNGFVCSPLPVFFKRNNFEYEREYRIGRMYMFANTIDEDPFEALNNSKAKDSEYFDIDIKELIEEIYVSPYADNSFNSLVINILREYNLDVPVNISTINDDPLKVWSM